MEGDDKFSIGTPRPLLARQTAKFNLASIVDGFCEKHKMQVKLSKQPSFGTTQERL